MKVPLSWLREFVALRRPLTDDLERLVEAGFEIGGVVQRGVPDTASNLDHFRIGRVVTWEQHPNADRLRLCRVDTGDAEPRQIVCGASNFDVGDTVAVITPGGILPGADGPLRAAKLRGEVSEGMMLSERELALSDEHDGIIVLPPIYEIGSPLADHAAIAETVVDFETTTNRPDLLSVYGIAREIAAILDLKLAPYDASEPTPAPTSAPAARLAITIAIEAPERCFRFVAREFRDVEVRPSSLRVRQRLAAAGMRPISNVVDVTNYVMLELGQPLHAYDAACVPGRILTARMARAGEELVTLDGRRRRLDPDMLVIADADGPNGLAGVMGGADSEISAATTEVILEAANFERSGIGRTSRALGLWTEGATRWTRGVDPHLGPLAAQAAARMLVAGGATLAAGVADVRANVPDRTRVTLRPSRAREVLGIDVPAAEQQATLARLGYEPRLENGAIEVTVPTWRALDTTREIDLVEEVGRVHGYSHLPATVPTGGDGGLSPSQRLRRRCEDVLTGLGLHEAYTISLVNAESAARLDPPPVETVVRLANPLTSDFAELRTTIVPSLLDALRRNRAVGRDDVALFEIAHVYRAVDAARLPDEPWTLAIAGVGRIGSHGWLGDGLELDFSGLRAIADTLLGRLGVTARYVPLARPALHPGRAATILVDDEPIGHLAELHPEAAGRFELDTRVVVAEIDLDLLLGHLERAVVYRTVPTTPPVIQDIAVVVDDGIAAGDVLAEVRAAGAPLLTDAVVFDVYRDAERLGANRRSLALRLTFQDPERTLTEDEASAVRATIVARLEDRFDAELRSA